MSSNSFWRFPSITGNDRGAAHRPLWMAAITVPWPFKSHTNKEIYDLVQCAIKAHEVIPSTFTARRGYAALLLRVYSLLVEKQLLVFLGGKTGKGRGGERVWMREAAWLNVSRYLNIWLCSAITPDCCTVSLSWFSWSRRSWFFSRFPPHRVNKKVLKLGMYTVDHMISRNVQIPCSLLVGVIIMASDCRYF